MVHYKDPVLHHNDSNEENDNNFQESDDSIVIPEWTIDEDGIPYCTKQTDYQKIIESNLKKRFPHEFEKMLHCHHCEHYRQDDCYFPKSEIDKIENDRNSLRIRCQLCGAKIDRLFSILMSLYYKEKFGVNMPVICCSCYNSLENNTYERNSKRRMILFVISFLTSFYFLSTYLISLFQFQWLGFLFFLLPFTFWGYISIRDLKNIYYLHKGRKYYKQITQASEVEVESPEDLGLERREALLDKDDKEKPDGGAFHSPGYEY
ncbi:MAG: hypothetical protein DRO88_09585 [Promethearchaeia archaeon]|nr:MAG: hypothetical protein DRO88_09585 [Candidatus Lokiarchaeia archaeon]